MEKDLISVIIPVYNIEIYIKRCVNSIINQTYKNLEIILVDDGSTDNSGKICDDYEKKDARIKVIHKENGGLSDARNCGIEKSNGKYITTVDGDDFVTEKYVETLYNLIIENSADISSINRFDFLENDANGKCIKVEYYNNCPKVTVFSSKEYEIKILKDKLPHEAWAKLYKKEIFEKNRYEKGLQVYEDLEFIIRILDNQNLKIVCDTSIYEYYYRRRNNSIMKSKYNDLFEREIDYYVSLISNNRFKESKEDIRKNISQKIIRNINKAIESEKNEKIFVNLKYSKFINFKQKIKVAKNIIKRIIVYILDKKEKIKFSKKFRNYLKTCKKNPALLFNGPITGNIGDHAILFAEEELLKKQDKYVFLVSAKDMKTFYKTKSYEKVNKNAEIYITGGGNTGSLWRNEQTRINQVLDTFKENKIVIFPQTIYYSEDDFGRECFDIDFNFYKKCKNIEFHCRDKKTYEYVKEKIKIPVIMGQDVVLTMDYTNLKFDRSGILFCFRRDFEKNIDDKKKNQLVSSILTNFPNEKYEYIDTVVNNKKMYLYKDGKKEFDKILKKFASSKLVVTDRLHGMLIAYITGTPCIAINNLSGKVKGVYDTINDKDGRILFLEQKEIIKINDKLKNLNV